jgi:sporulation protein YlmC with PRC-barrel domain
MRQTPLKAMMLLSTALALTVTYPSVVPAQSPPETGTRADRLQVEQSARPSGIEADTVWANDLIGRSVIGADGEVLGRVDNFLLSLSGGIEHLIVSRGGFLGMGGREVAISWSEAKTEPGSDDIRVTLTRSDFENAPVYEATGLGSAVAGPGE